MHISYWNLHENPFQNVADTRYAYVGEQHRESLARLLYLVTHHKVGGILVGAYGVGKSMMLELLADRIEEQGQPDYLQIDGSSAGPASLARAVLRRLGYRETVYDIHNALEQLGDHFRHGNAQSSHLVLTIDEAHLLSEPDAFEFLHLLTNLRMRRPNGRLGEPAITLVLCGHPSLLDTVNRNTALSQRLQLAWTITPLDESQTVEYVHSRIKVAGGDVWVFDSDSLPILHRATGGLPRLINTVCDIALVLGAGVESERVTADIMRQAIAESRAETLRKQAIEQDGEL